MLQHARQAQAVYGSLAGPEQQHHGTQAEAGARAVGDPEGSAGPDSITASLRVGEEQLQQQQRRQAMSVYDTAGRDTRDEDYAATVTAAADSEVPASTTPQQAIGRDKSVLNVLKVGAVCCFSVLGG